MRTPILALAAFFLATAIGCSVLDEIDDAHAMIGIGKEKKSEKQQANAEEAVKKGVDWTVSHSINTGQVDPSIINCKLGGATKFMRKDDCISQGGRPNKI